MAATKRVLVTGAAGFIGSHTAIGLAINGYKVTGVDNFDPYYNREDKKWNVGRVRSAGVDFRQADIRHYEDTASLFDVTRPEVVVHLAAKAGVRNSVRFPRQYFETNLLGTQNVLDACRSVGVKRVVMASTSSVYGHTSVIPFVESDACGAPLHPYAASKRSAELLASTYAHQYGLQVTVCRLFTVYGPNGRPDMMPRLLLESLSSGVEIPLFQGALARDWTYIDDVVSGLLSAVERPLGFEIVNLGRGNSVLLSEFIDSLERVSGRRANLVARERPSSEMLSTHGCVKCAAELLGFSPSIDIEEGAQRTWKWWEDYNPRLKI